MGGSCTRLLYHGWNLQIHLNFIRFDTPNGRGSLADLGVYHATKIKNTTPLAMLVPVTISRTRYSQISLFTDFFFRPGVRKLISNNIWSERKKNAIRKPNCYCDTDVIHSHAHHVSWKWMFSHATYHHGILLENRIIH